MTDKQPEALRLAEMLTADEWPGSVTLVSYAQECVAELLRLHAENETLRAGYAAARGDALDAARYRWLRDGEWRDTDLEPFIRLQLNTLWDAKIDDARAAQEGEK